MPGLSDLLRPSALEVDDSALATLMVGRIVDTDPLRVTVPTIDGGRLALAAFGTVPSNAAVGDSVRVLLDEFGELIVAAWDTAPVAGDSAVGAWQALGTSLAPKWRTPANTSITDLTDPFCPRYYIDRGRVYLGGVVLLDDTIADSHNASIISAGLPSDAQTARDQHFRITEDVYFSGAGWAGDIGFVTGPPGTSKLALTSHPPDAIAVALDAISYRQ